MSSSLMWGWCWARVVGVEGGFLILCGEVHGGWPLGKKPRIPIKQEQN